MSEPTFDQLVNFATVYTFGPGAPREITRALFERSPAMVDLWREQHAVFVRRLEEQAQACDQQCRDEGGCSGYCAGDGDPTRRPAARP